MAKMDERLEKMVERYREINDLMMQSDVVSDRKTMAKLGREQNELTPIVETYEEYKKAVEELEEAKVLSKEEDKEIREMAQMELEELEPKIQNYLDPLELHLQPKLVETKEISLPETYLECIQNMQRQKVGEQKSLKWKIVKLEDSHWFHLKSMEKGLMEL